MPTTQIRKRQIADGAIDNAKIQAAAAIDTSKLAEGSLFIKSTQLVVREAPTGTMDGTNKDFTLTAAPISGTEQVFLNGQLVQLTSDYTIAAAVITLVDAPFTGESVLVTYRKVA